MLHVELAGHRMEMLGTRALWWPSRRALVCADLHLGKDASFRALGVAIPEGSDAATLARLGNAVRQQEADELIVLGDLFHARHGLGELRQSAASAFFVGLPARKLLIMGNHDIHAPVLAGDWGFEVVAEGLVCDGVELRHKPFPESPTAMLAGHWHPSVRLATGAKSSLRLPAYLLDGQCLVLPAFGELTGSADVAVGPGRRRFACVDGAAGPLVQEV